MTLKQIQPKNPELANADLDDLITELMRRLLNDAIEVREDYLGEETESFDELFDSFLPELTENSGEMMVDWAMAARYRLAKAKLITTQIEE